MGYLDFHMTFIVPPLAALAILVGEREAESRRRIFEAAGLLAILATLWATPWDNYMVATDVWYYSGDAVIWTVGYIPLEEQLFFVFQPLLTVFLLGLLRNGESTGRVPNDPRRLDRAGYLLAGLLSAVALVAGLLFWTGAARYLTAILAWFLPVAALQVAVGFRRLVLRWRLVLISIAGPTTYLCLADAIAIDQKHWTIHPDATVGVEIVGLPIEEMVFFFVTNAVVVGGALLYLEWYDSIRGTASRKRRVDADEVPRA